MFVMVIVIIVVAGLTFTTKAAEDGTSENGVSCNATHFLQNASNMMHLLPPKVSMAVKITMTTCNGLLLLGSFLGNVLVVEIVRSNVRMRTATNILIMNMAISDLLIALLFIPSQTIRLFIGSAWFSGIAGIVTCKAVMISRIVSVACSTLSLVAIAIDRCQAVAQPFYKHTSHNSFRTKVVVCVIWLLSLLICIPPMSSYKLIEMDGSAYCTVVWLSSTSGRLYIVLGFLVTFILPLLIIMTLYVIIAVKLHLRNSKIPANEIFQKRALVTSRHVTKMMVTVVIAFALCMFPIQIYLLIRFLRNDVMTAEWLFWGMTVTVFISNFNTFTNPCIYACYNEQFRRGFKKLLLCRKDTMLYSETRSKDKNNLHAITVCKIPNLDNTRTVHEKKESEQDIKLSELTKF